MLYTHLVRLPRGCFAAAAVIGAFHLPGNAAETNPVHYSISAQADGRIEVATSDGARARFAPEFLVLHTSEDPNLEMRWGQFQAPALRENDTGSLYNVLTWGGKSAGPVTAAHVEDGFDPNVDRGYGPGRTADVFAAGRKIPLRGSRTTTRDGRTAWRFPESDAVRLSAEIFLSDDKLPPLLRFTATVKRDGWYSFGYVGARETALAEVAELWQPLIWNERRLPDQSYLEAGYRCPLPTTLVTQGDTTVGVLADPAEYPFQPLPNFQNSRFGVALRNARGFAQPMLFAPILGGFESRMKAGETRVFTVRLFVAKEDLSTSYERIARTLFDFKDVRHNALGSLNTTFERMLEFGLSEYAKFNSELRGFAYDTDVPGAVKNVSALHPLALSLVTDNAEIFTRLAHPLMEYFVSRERFLFTTDPKTKGQSASSRLGGLGAPLTEYAALHAIAQGRTPFFRLAAESLFGKDRVLNLEGKLRGDNWSNALALYRATGERRWLEHAIRDADEYLRRRVAVRQTDFEDPDSRGLFFWPAFVPQWIELFELYEETRERRFLEAAHQGARAYAQFVWMSPKIPDAQITVNEGGLAPAYRSGPRFPRIKLPEETVPAWRVSEIGLTSESAPTSKGARGIFFACYAPWMLRISALTGDTFLHDIARSAIIGRYTSFPGYHLNTARTTAYEKPDFARRGKDELNSATSIHYNHIWPHIALLLDYLVSDGFAKSRGAVDFPSRYAEGYGYLQQKVYGDRPGRVYDLDGAHLWMPRGVAEVSHPELNYIVARTDDAVAIVLTNQSKAPVRSKVRLNPDLVRYNAGSNAVRATLWENNIATRKTGLGARGEVEVEVRPEGIAAVVIRGVTPQVTFQRAVLAPSPALPAGSVSELGWRGAKGVAISFGPRELTTAYVYLPDIEREIVRCTLRSQQRGSEPRVMTDHAYPFEFTISTAGDAEIEWSIEVELEDGRVDRSPLGRIELR